METKKPTYPQNWSAYDLAKTNEATFFRGLLEELLDAELSNKEEPPTGGRRRFSLKTRIFCICMKIYFRADLRKCVSFLKEFHKLGYIEKVPSYKSIDNFLNDKAIIPILEKLIFISALPLAEIEQTLAADSTGFSLSRFDQWSEFKWGKRKGKERRWIKAHALGGCLTNIILSVELTKKYRHDATVFERLVMKKTTYFNAEEFVADMAYSSKAILETCKKLRLMPYIPFKKNARGRSRGSPMWRQMFNYFKANQEFFYQKYHQRSNIESTFHMVKKRFGDNLATNDLIANEVELKAKFLCHNICVLIQEVMERGILVNFNECVKTVNPMEVRA